MVLLVGSLPDLNPEPGRAEAQYGGLTGCWLLAAGCWLLATVDWKCYDVALAAVCHVMTMQCDTI